MKSVIANDEKKRDSGMEDFPYLFLFVNTLLKMIKGVLKYMAEAIIAGHGSGDRGLSTGHTYHRDILLQNGYYIVPDHVGNFTIIVMGGGGGAGCWKTNKENTCWGGGGGGNFNNASKDIAASTNVLITIGEGGLTGTWSGTNYAKNSGSRGGTTSFGSYLSATGGEGGQAFNWGVNGGNGGAGGGGGCCGTSASYNGGNGGTYGGGGACHYTSTGVGGKGWTYGGNGGNKTTESTNGRNTLGWTNVNYYWKNGMCVYIVDPGLRSGWNDTNYYGEAGGGFGGRGGNSSGMENFLV